MTECYEKNIKGKSYLMNKKSIQENFDLFIFTVGWESRCTEITEYFNENFFADYSVLLSFQNSGVNGYKQEYMDTIKSIANNHTTENQIYIINQESNELDNITQRLSEYVKTALKRKRQPLKIGFDITCCPRYFYLYILSYCIKNEIAETIKFFYSEGKYVTDSKEFVHTKGDWKLTQVHGFEGDFNPEHKKYFIVSAGFEGSRYRSLIATYEPYTVGILLPDPGVNSEYTQKSFKECEPLIEEYNIQKAIVRASAGDAMEAWCMLKDPVLNDEYMHINYLTVGPKPHVLAMGLHAVMNENISVTYRIPEGYTRMEVEPMGNFWCYEIKNMIFL